MGNRYAAKRCSSADLGGADARRVRFFIPTRSNGRNTGNDDSSADDSSADDSSSSPTLDATIRTRRSNGALQRRHVLILSAPQRHMLTSRRRGEMAVK